MIETFIYRFCTVYRQTTRKQWTSTNHNCFHRSRASENRPRNRTRSNRSRKSESFLHDTRSENPFLQPCSGYDQIATSSGKVGNSGNMYTLISGVDPYGTGGTCPPTFALGDMPMNAPPNIWEFLFLKHQYLAAT